MDGQSPAWVRDTVFYQVFPDRFARSARVAKPGQLEAWDSPPTTHGFKGGDLLGIVDHLDYLSNLGVTGLYLNPVFASASNHRYQTYDYLKVDPLLGGNEAFRELLDEAHRRDMRVVVDGVFNHSGRGFWPFHHVLETGASSPYRDWFHLDPNRLAQNRQLGAYAEAMLPGGPASQDWAAEHGAGEHSIGTIGYRAWWDLPALPKLNVSNPEVRGYLLDVATHWTRFGVDGWRLDVPQEIDRGFWLEFRERVTAVNPESYLLGEIWRPAPNWTLPDGPFDGLMNYPLAWAIIGYAGGRWLDPSVTRQQSEMQAGVAPISAEELFRRVTGLLTAYPDAVNGRHLSLLGSHDTPRLRSAVGGDDAAIRLAFLLLMAMPGAPCIFYGDEIGLTGGADPACRASFPWDDVDPGADGLRDFVRSTVAVRGSTPALRQPEVTLLAARGAACAMRRGTGPEAAVLLLNAGERPIELLADLGAASRREFVACVGSLPRAAAALDDMGRTTVLIPPRSGCIARVRD